KIRGATNKVKAAIRDGATDIVTASSGNHGQAVAYVGNQLQVKTTVVVPETVSAAKEEAIQGYGAHIQYCGTTSEERIHMLKLSKMKREPSTFLHMMILLLWPDRGRLVSKFLSKYQRLK